MLSLRRKKGEVVVIRHRGEELRVHVVRIRPGREGVDLAFEDGPRHFKVDRLERLADGDPADGDAAGAGRPYAGTSASAGTGVLTTNPPPPVGA